MKGLLYKEFVQNQKTLLLLFFIMLLMSSVMFGQNEEVDAATIEMVQPLIGMMVYSIIFFMLNLFQPNFMQADEHKKWSGFVISSPNGVEKIVYAKYVFLLMLTGLVTIWCFVIDGLSGSINGIGITGTGIYISFFYLNLFLTALDMPFMMRFGTRAGGIYRSVLFFGVVIVGFVYALFGDLSMFGSLEDFCGRIYTMFISEELPGWMLLLSGVFPFVSMALYYTSYKLSCKLYVKGVTHYE